jgi:hypothetical protein
MILLISAFWLARITGTSLASQALMPSSPAESSSNKCLLAGEVVQMIERLLSKCKALSSNPSTSNKCLLALKSIWSSSIERSCFSSKLYQKPMTQSQKSLRRKEWL